MATIGIDLGTYNSAAAYMDDNRKIVLLQSSYGPTFQGDYVIPSFIKFRADGEFEKYGEEARKDLEIAPHLVVWGVKRLIGQPYKMAKEKRELDRFQYPNREAPDGSILIPISDKVYTPVKITKILLEKIKADCEAPHNPVRGRINKAVITRPAYFDGPQIQEVEDAAKEAGFEEIELLTEPEAAALAYKDILDFKSERWVMVIDWGAGTLDMVVTKFHLDDKGIPRISHESPPYGDNRLGGIDMDEALLKEAKRLYDLDLDNMIPREKGKLCTEIELGKIDLSTQPHVKRYFLYNGKNKPLKMARNIECIPPNESKENWILLEGDPEKDIKGALDDISLKFKGRLVGALQGIGPLVLLRQIIAKRGARVVLR